jgi:transposase, IS5 family
MIKQNNLLSFADLAVVHRAVPMPLFDRVNAIIDWKEIENEISKSYNKGRSVDGRESYSPLILFKMMLLQTWYGLSDKAIEMSVRDRISFSKFCEISMDESVPDSTVLCRFRNTLAKSNALEKLLKIINQRLESGNLMVIEGVIIDASVTATLRKPRGKKEYELVVEDRNEAACQSSQPESQLKAKIQSHVDTDGAWIKKSGKLMYGYKQHTVTNQEGFVLGIHTTSANQSDVKNLKPALDKVTLKPRTPVNADKGYVSAENDKVLIEKRLKNRILHKAVKNKPLTALQKKINKKISQTRYKIERTFGSMHRWFKAATARYVGLEKTHAQHLLQGICYNLYRQPIIPC